MKNVIDLRDQIIHRTLKVPYRLNVIDHGGSGPVVIFLHGIASSSSNWEHMIPLLKSDYRCVTIDLLGFGLSPKPQWLDYTVDDHIRSIHRTLKPLRLKQPYTLIGHSMGSLLAARYTTLYPNRIDKLLLLSPPVYLHPERIQKKTARHLTSVYLRAYRFIRTHKRVTPQNVTRLARILPLPKGIVMDDRTWIPFVRSLEHCIENQTIIDDLAKIKIPIDVYYGIFDQFIVQGNIKLLDTQPNINIHKLRADHAVGKYFARKVANQLTSNSS